MANNISTIVDEFVERIKAASDMATDLAIVTILRSLLLELAACHDVEYLAQHVLAAEQNAHKALELWDRFWSITIPSVE